MGFLIILQKFSIHIYVRTLKLGKILSQTLVT